jgi:hypothetical protein
MSSGPNSPGRSPDDGDLGRPALELVRLEQEPSADFVPIVRRKIYRRTAASQFVSFTWNVPGVVLRELLTMAVELFKGTKTRA